MAGDGTNNTGDSKAGAVDPKNPLANINLISLHAKDQPQTQKKAAADPDHQTLELAQERGPNGRLKGPAGQNPYLQPGGGVAPAFKLPDGTRPQDKIPGGTPGTIPGGAPNWDQQAQQGQKRLDDMAQKNQDSVHQTTQAMGPQGGSGDGKQFGILGPAIAVGLATTYSKFGHPMVQRALIPAQLRADGLVEAGAKPSLNPLAIARKGYLEGTSPLYQAETQLERVKTLETATQTHLAQVKSAAQERLEALGGSAKTYDTKIAALEKVAQKQGLPADELAKAERQIAYLKEVKAAGNVTPAQAHIVQNGQLDFLAKNSRFFDGTVNPGTLEWGKFNEAMGKVPGFTKAEVEPVAKLAAKEQPFAKVGSAMLDRAQLAAKVEAGGAALESKAGLFKKFGVPLLAVGTEAYFQNSAAMSLAQGGHTDLARIAQPNLPGKAVETTALILGSNPKAKLIGWAGAHLYEAETNMNSWERLGTAGVGLLPSVGLKVFGKGKFDGVAATLAVADLGIWAASELTDDLLYKKDKTLENSKSAIEKINADPNDFSRSGLDRSVQALVAQGKENPFLMTQNYDAAHQPGMLVTTADSIDMAKVKYKSQMVIDQAQGETILSNGLTKSQYLKMQDSKQQIPDPPGHKEEWRLAPAERIDIGGQATKTLIGAVGSANLLQYTLARQPEPTGFFSHKPSDDIKEVEKQKQAIKDELNELLMGSHRNQIENALKKSTWGYGKTSNDYNLPELWKASGLLPGQANGNFDYAHATTTMRDNATAYAAGLPTMQQKLDAAKQALDAAKANPANDTDVATKERLLQARQDALDYTTMYVGKLYRDYALMRMGQVQAAVLQAAAGKTVSGQDQQALMDQAMEGLNAAARYAPNAPDQANMLTVYRGLSKQAATIERTPDFQPNK